MSVVHVSTLAFSGVKALDIDVQVSVANGLPSFNIVGLADKAVVESKERIRAALSAMGLSMLQKRVTINLSPASIAKQGTHYDLPIMMGLLISMSLLPGEAVGNYISLGELSLDGSLLPVKAVLPAAMHALKLNMGIICPINNGPETLFSSNKMVLACENMIDIINHFKGHKLIEPVKCASPLLIEGHESQENNSVNINNVKGQNLAKRALIIAASGGHNILMVGAPGVGKSMLAKCMVDFLPSMTAEEILENAIINSIAGNSQDIKKIIRRPFRAPHHSCSLVAMVGGGSNAMPGEITLAHNGVLFLDELAEFNRDVLDSLRQPVENKEVLIARAKYHVTYPAKFQLVAAMNPCKCGYLFDPARVCKNAPHCGFEYQTKKVSGPIIDRFDLHLEVSNPFLSAAEHRDQIYDLKQLKERINTARLLQRERYNGINGVQCNADAGAEVLEQACALENKEKEVLSQAAKKYNMSMRAYFKVLKVARTIADLDHSEKVSKTHLSEAIYYRPYFNR